MQQSRTLSIIIPVHGNEQTLRRTLHSVSRLADTGPDPWSLEIVVVLDGLVDASDVVVAAWRPSAPSVLLTLITQPHSGIAAARNAGVAAASGTVLTFLDADDEVCPARLTAADRVLETGQVLIGTQTYVVADGCRIPGASPLSGQLSEGPDFYFTSMVVRSDVLMHVGPFSTDYTLGDDLDMVFRMRRMRVPIVMVDEEFAIRHIHERNASHDEHLMQREFLRIVRAHRAAGSAFDDGAR